MYSQSVKEWLKMIYDAIMTYDKDQPNANNIIVTAQDTLKNFRDNHDDHDELVISTKETREKCNPNEWYMAEKIFESACNVFGHGTVRLILSFMIDFNKDGTIKILNSPGSDSLGKIHSHIGFVPRSLLTDSPINSYLSDRNALQHLISIFLLDSHIYIPRTDIKINSRTNSYVFGFGPIAYSSEVSFSRVRELTKASISWNLADQLKREYLSTHGGGYQGILEEYHRSQTILFNLFGDLIDEQTLYLFNNPDLSSYERSGLITWFSKKVKDYCRRGIFDYQSTSFRKEVEDFRASGNYLYDFEFKIQVPGRSYFVHLGLQESFRLSATIRDLESINFRSWGTSTSSIYTKGILSYNYNKLRNQNVANFVQKAKSIIEKFGTDGKVIIQPATSSNDPTLGYQHLRTAKLKNTKYLPYETPVFVIDLNNKEESTYILEHIAHVIATKDTAFIFKEWVDIDKDYAKFENRLDKMREYFNDYKEMITAVDFTGFLRIEDIYSGYSANEQIIINGYLTDSQGRTFFDREVFKEFDNWDEKIWTIKWGLNPYGTFLTFYFNEIKNGLTPRADFMRRILGL